MRAEQSKWKPNKADLTLFWLFTGPLAILMVGSAAQALLDLPWALALFERLGFPTYLVLPLEIAKLLGVAALVINVSPFLKNLAYAGFSYHLLLALSAHFAAGDGPDRMIGAAAGLALLAGSFHFDRKLLAGF